MPSPDIQISHPEPLPKEIASIISAVKRPLKGIQDNRKASPMELTRLQMEINARDFLSYGMPPEEVAAVIREVFKGVLSPDLSEEGNNASYSCQIPSSLAARTQLGKKNTVLRRLAAE